MDASQAQLVETPVGMLRIGMYVAALDRPWLETPFAVQGFFVESEADIDYVATHCRYVLVDPRRRAARPITEPRFSPREGDAGVQQLQRALKLADQDLRTARGAVDKVFGELRRNRHVDRHAIEAVVEPLIDGILRDQDAIPALLRMREKNEYLQSHCLSTAVWAAMLGRHMGFARDDLKVLATGAAMIDLGMVNVPRHVMEKPGPLSATEFELVQRHVKDGVKLAEASGTFDHRVIEIIACHHERHSGAGYPR